MFFYDQMIKISIIQKSFYKICLLNADIDLVNNK